MTTLDQFISRQAPLLRKGPIGVVFAEDGIEVESTVNHLLRIGFVHVLLLGSDENISANLGSDTVSVVSHTVHGQNAVPSALNKVIAAAKGSWIHYCYNGEYFFYPFSESRTIAEMLAFHTEERREAMLTYVVDLYAEDLRDHPNGVDMETAMFDATGYFALQRYRGREDTPLDRQMDIFGGPRWRFEEHIPFRSRKIDRIGLFRAKSGLLMRPDFTLNDEEMNTISCPWHNNITAAIASFRATKALCKNPGSAVKIDNFTWQGSRRFDWNSQQFLDLGLIEPGQWF